MADKSRSVDNFLITSRHRWGLPLILLVTSIQMGLVQPFSSGQVFLPAHRRHENNIDITKTLRSSSMNDYEYIPMNEKPEHNYSTKLPSVYRDGTPAGLRGEAVRSALKSSQCLTWQLATSEDAATKESPNLASGVLTLEGKGVLDFLNNKLSNSFVPMEDNQLTFRQAGLLTAKGRLVDTISVLFSKEKAYLMPSPGHSAASLFQKLDPFIFPMDQVKLKDLSSNSFMFTLVSTRLDHVQSTVQEQFLPKLKEYYPGIAATITDFPLPDDDGRGLEMELETNSQADGGGTLLILPHTGLPECACVGYTFVFLNDLTNAGTQIWRYLVGDANVNGPVEIQALEYETLRIEAGQPAFGNEVTGAWKESKITSPSPLELYQKENIIDFEKGCYLGQEGIASVMKNPRGPPRSLYSIVFEDDDNLYESQTRGDDEVENLTKLPRPGDALFVLGSNEEIQVGTITSIAEPYSTGESTIVGLALVRRPDSVLKQMKSKDLQIPRTIATSMNINPAENIDETPTSALIPPPPMDSLDGLEVIVGGTFTIGMLRGIPSRRYPKGKSMFVDRENVFLSRQEILGQGYVDIEFSDKSPTEVLEQKKAELEQDELTDTTDDRDIETGEEDTKKAEEQAAAEAEAKRKEEKMKRLQQKAEEAMARRLKKKQGEEPQTTNPQNELDGAPPKEDAEAAEAKRKAEKMEMLRQRAEEAKARRKNKKEQQG